MIFYDIIKKQVNQIQILRLMGESFQRGLKMKNEITKYVEYDDALIEQLADDVMKLQDSENTVVPVLKNQLAEVEKGIENLLNAIMMGICGESTKNKMAELEARKSELQIQIAKEELGKPMVSREIIVFWFHKF